MRPYTPIVQTLYQELVQQVHAETEKSGSIYVRTIKGIEYAYLKEPVGISRRDVFLGRNDDPSVQERKEKIGRSNESLKQRRLIVRSLLASGVPAPNSTLGDVLDALAKHGLLRETVLVGTAAYQCLSPVIGVTLPSATLTTQDADLATASLALSGDIEGESFETILKRADPTFSAIPALKRNAPPSSFRATSGFVVDLLTPQLRRDDINPMPLEKLRAGAVPLQYLRWLLDHPIPAVALHGSGIALHVPSPSRYAIHKLILAQKRTSDRGKRQKDLLQAKALIEALKVTDRWALADAYEEACQQGLQGWRQPIERSLKEIRLSLDPDA